MGEGRTVPTDAKLNRRSRRPLILAHRGASHAAPENTMAAFRLAAEMGADGVELDVQLCEDVEAVVFHNARVDETTDGGGRVVDLTPAELQGLDAGAWFVPDLAGERIPTLAQVLHELGARLALDIELKTGGLFSDGLEAEIVTLVEESNIGLRVVACIFRAEN